MKAKTPHHILRHAQITKQNLPWDICFNPDHDMLKIFSDFISSYQPPRNILILNLITLEICSNHRSQCLLPKIVEYASEVDLPRHSSRVLKEFGGNHGLNTTGLVSLEVAVK